jgi:hypothetical protein
LSKVILKRGRRRENNGGVELNQSILYTYMEMS